MIEIAGFSLRLYGLILTMGILVAVWVSSRLAEKNGYDPKLINDVVSWVIVGGIIGARLYHVIDLWEYYGQNLWQIVAVWNGGLGIFGALVGGFLGLASYGYFCVKNDRFKTLRGLTDIGILGVPLAQSIGRWGNFVNEELYGYPTDLPWAIYIHPESRLPGFEEIERYHPLFLYESLLSLLLFVILIELLRRKIFRLGELKFLGLYLAGYGLIRFLLEFLRLEKWQINGIATAQIVSVGMILLGLFLLLRSITKRNKNDA